MFWSSVPSGRCGFWLRGTLARWAREGAKIAYCICTSGEKGTDDPSMTNLKLARTREKEQRAAAKVIGAEEVIYFATRWGAAAYPRISRGIGAGHPPMPPPHGFYPRPGQSSLRCSVYLSCRSPRGRRNGVRCRLPGRRKPEFFPRPPGRGIGSPRGIGDLFLRLRFSRHLDRCRSHSPLENPGSALPPKPDQESQK